MFLFLGSPIHHSFSSDTTNVLLTQHLQRLQLQQQQQQYAQCRASPVPMLAADSPLPTAFSRVSAMSSSPCRSSPPLPPPSSSSVAAGLYLDPIHSWAPVLSSPQHRNSPPPSSGFTESPTHVASYARIHVQTSPPPSFQNLGMIQEDTEQLPGSPPSENDELVSSNSSASRQMRSDNDAPSSSGQPSQYGIPSSLMSQIFSGYSLNPQISITDEMGAVTIANASSESGIMDMSVANLDVVNPLPLAPNSSFPPYGPCPSIHANHNAVELPLNTPIQTNSMEKMILPQQHSLYHTISSQDKFSYSDQSQQSIIMPSQPPGYQYPTDSRSLEFDPLHGNVMCEGLDSLPIDLSCAKLSLDKPDVSKSISVENQPSSPVPELQKTPSGSIQFELSKSITASMCVPEILSQIKQVIEAKVPNLVCQYSNNGFAIEHPTGVQIELELFEEPMSEYKGLKMRRISGDNLFYNRLCQELISCMNS